MRSLESKESIRCLLQEETWGAMRDLNLFSTPLFCSCYPDASGLFYLPHRANSPVNALARMHQSNAAIAAANVTKGGAAGATKLPAPAPRRQRKRGGISLGSYLERARQNLQ